MAEQSIQSQQVGSDQAHLNSIKALLREKEPKLEELLTEAMKKERASQAQKDQKVLEILQYKDQQIGEMQQHLQALTGELQQHKLLVEESN